MVLVIDVDLPAVKVLQQFQHDFISVVFDQQLLGFLLAHQRRKHGPELLALRGEDSFVGVNFLVLNFYGQVRKVLLVEKFVLEVFDVGLADLVLDDIFLE